LEVSPKLERIRISNSDASASRLSDESKPSDEQEKDDNIYEDII